MTRVDSLPVMKYLPIWPCLKYFRRSDALILAVIPFSHFFCDSVRRRRGKVVKEQVKGLVSALTRRHKDERQMLRINQLWKET